MTREEMIKTIEKGISASGISTIDRLLLLDLAKDRPAPAVRRAERKRIADSIGRWLMRNAPSGEDGADIRMVAGDLLNGEWEEDTAGGMLDAKDGG